MRNSIYPIWVFVVVALLIALAAFVVGQLHRGSGMIVVGAGSMLWAAFVARRGAIQRAKND